MSVDSTNIETKEIKRLANSDDLLNKERYEVALEIYSSALSKYTEDHPDLNQKFKPVRFEENGDGSIKIFNADGLELNSILPKNIRLINVHSANLRYSGSDDVRLLPENFEKGLTGIAILAHEVGEALDPNTTEDQFEAYRLDCLRYGDKHLSANERIQSILDVMAVVLRGERDAWDYGKTVADFFGVDEILYEDLMHTAMATYYFHYFSKILPSEFIFLKKNEITPETKFRIYSLALQEKVETDFKDLYQAAQEAKEKELSIKSMELFERTTGISSKRMVRIIH